MSVAFVDGPAAGHDLSLRRAPLLLRVVVDTTKLRKDGLPRKGAVDALDLLDDDPRNHEAVHVYELYWSNGTVHMCMRGRGSGWYALAGYRHRPDVDGEQLRETNAWRRWAVAEGFRLRPNMGREAIPAGSVTDLAERRKGGVAS